MEQSEGGTPAEVVMADWCSVEAARLDLVSSLLPTERRY